MASRLLRQKVFKRLEVAVYDDNQVDLNLNEQGWRSVVLPLVVKPRKLARELRRVARWLDKQ